MIIMIGKQKVGLKKRIGDFNKEVEKKGFFEVRKLGYNFFKKLL